MRKVLGIGAAVLCSLVVLFTGCSAPSTPSAPEPVLDTIEITTEPAKKEYHIGDEIDLTGIVVTASYNDGSTKTLGATEYTVTGFDSTAYVNDKEITVTYNEKTDTFKINVVFNWYETPVQLSDDKGGTYGTEGTYVLFGVWPQDVVPEDEVEGLNLDEEAATTVTRGYLKYVKGSDGNYYVKCTENAYVSGYKYKKDDSDVKQGGTTSRWFKVMPIKWCVVDTAYKDASGSSQGKLLVAESILTANVPYYNYGSSSRTRTVGTKTGIYPNNYEFSQIRAYLNGLDYYYDTSDTDTTIINTYTNKGFLQTAFTSDAINKIITTKVDNAKEQMSYNGTNDIKEEYACGPTYDKIFLLSEKEVVKYSKKAYTSSDNSRIRVTTDFAKANYALQSTTDGWGGYWWLRSPYNSLSNDARNVDYRGDASLHFEVETAWTGVVPALSISF